MKKDNLSIKKDGQKEEIIETNEELKGNKFLIFLCNLMDPINNKCTKNRNNNSHVFINVLLQKLFKRSLALFKFAWNIWSPLVFKRYGISR